MTGRANAVRFGKACLLAAIAMLGFAGLIVIMIAPVWAFGPSALIAEMLIFVFAVLVSCFMQASKPR